MTTVDHGQEILEALAGAHVCEICNNGVVLGKWTPHIHVWAQGTPRAGQRLSNKDNSKLCAMLGVYTSSNRKRTSGGTHYPINTNHWMIQQVRNHCTSCHIEQAYTQPGHYCPDPESALVARCPVCKQLHAVHDYGGWVNGIDDFWEGHVCAPVEAS